MSRSKNNGKNRRSARRKPESKDIAFNENKRHHFGSTEKIRRRNRKIWTRLVNKQKRAIDKKELTDQETE